MKILLALIVTVLAFAVLNSASATTASIPAVLDTTMTIQRLDGGIQSILKMHKKDGGR